MCARWFRLRAQPPSHARPVCRHVASRYCTHPASLTPLLPPLMIVGIFSWSGNCRPCSRRCFDARQKFENTGEWAGAGEGDKAEGSRPTHPAAASPVSPLEIERLAGESTRVRRGSPLASQTAAARPAAAPSPPQIVVSGGSQPRSHPLPPPDTHYLDIGPRNGAVNHSPPTPLPLTSVPVPPPSRLAVTLSSCHRRCEGGSNPTARHICQCAHVGDGTLSSDPSKRLANARTCRSDKWT